ncbi:MAG: gliding motility protein GldM [Bacteroidales bacterium]|nr:gliding motility protein GldM [Bacteroidales bacterium]
MAGYKETPRQKMIAMMYLVLTALLALNVSVEILNAFLVVNDSMETTNQVFATKNEDLYKMFEKQYAQSPDKVGPFFNKAKEVKKLSEEMKTYINDMKYDMIAFSERIPVAEAKSKSLRELKGKDKYDQTTAYFIGQSEDGSKGKSKILKDRIIKYKQDLLNLVDPGNRGSIKLGLDTDGPFYNADGKKQNWEMHNFYRTILAADVTILNKFIAEVQNAEQDLVNHFMGQISATDFKIDQVGATVVPKSQYVFMGESYEAEVFVTAMDTKQNFTANIGGRGYTSEAGKVKVQLPATAPGPKTVTGNVMFKSPSGEIKPYPVSFDYIVAPPSLTVSPTKMNVLYVGVDNPVSISAGGVSDAQISAAITQGTIVRTANGWVSRVSQAGKATVTVTAKVGDRVKPMGAFEFRVKNVPSPTAYIANTDGGVVGREVLAASALIPRMPPDFEFDLNFIITSFTFSGNRKGDVIDYKGVGNKLTDEMRTFIKECKRGSKVSLEDIYAKGPDGKNRKLNSIVLTIQ